MKHHVDGVTPVKKDTIYRTHHLPQQISGRHFSPCGCLNR